MSNELGEFPSDLMPHNYKDNPYLGSQILEMLSDVVERYKEVRKAFKTKWTFPVKEVKNILQNNKSPELEISSIYLKEYNKLFTVKIDEAIKALLNLRTSGIVLAEADDPAKEHEVIEKLHSHLENFRRRTADAVWNELRANCKEAEKEAAAEIKAEAEKNRVGPSRCRW